MQPPPPAPRRQRLKRIALAFLVSGALVTFVVSQVDPDEAMARIRGADRGLLLSAFGLSFLMLTCRSLRFLALTTRTRVVDMFACIAAQVAVNRLAPLRLGELSLPFLLHRTSEEPPVPVVVNLLLIRLVELWVVLVAASVAAALWFTGDETTRTWAVGAAVGTLTLSLFAFRRLMRLGVRIGRVLVERTPLRTIAALPRILDKIEAAVDDDARLTIGQRAAVVGYSAATMGINYALFGTLLAALGYTLDPSQIVVGVTASQLAGALPVISVGSVGTHETGWVAGFVWVGMAVPDAMLTGLFTQVTTLSFAVLFAIPATVHLLGVKRRQSTV